MARKSVYSSYIETLSESERQEFISKIYELYMVENRTAKEISDILQLDYYVIRGCVLKNEMQKPREMVYKRIAENSARTNMEKYGTKCTLNTEESIKKKKETWMKNYGVDNPSKADVVKKKKEETSIKNYGVPYPAVLEEVQDKVKETCIKNYGVPYPLQSDVVKDKIVKTNLEKYGVTNTFQLQHAKEKAVESIRENIPDDVKSILYDKEKYREFLLSIPFEERSFSNICEKLGHFTITVPRMYYKHELTDIPILFSRSQRETEVEEYIRSINSNIKMSLNSRRIISPYELDLYIDNVNLGIEFNGNFWHSDDHKDINYHQEKSFYAKDKNIFIYHIWEYEWEDVRKRVIIKSQIRNLLGLSEKIYARTCKVREVSSKDSKNFLNANHLQGNRNSSIRLGLYHNNELVSLMTFGKNKFIRKGSDDIELLRFCNKLNTTVIGGASKLFKYFLKNYDYDTVVSYCNISKGTGRLYENLGFTLDSITEPNYVWVKGDNDVKTRYQCQMKNENETMKKDGYHKLHDCGNYKYIFRR